MNKDIIKSSYIAPWVLPREEIPIHLVWDTSFEFDCIQIILPHSIEVKEIFNVKSYEQLGSNLIIKELRSPNFFGLLVFSNEITKEKHEKKTITVNFMQRQEIRHSKSFIANIFRPSLTAEAPACVVLKDDSDLRNLINVSLKISGFGSIEIETELRTGGRFVPHVEPLYYELARRLVSTFKLSELRPDKRKEIEINPEYLQRNTKEFMEKVQKGELPLDVSENDLHEFQRWLNDKQNYAKITEFISTQLENLLAESLLFYFDRYPTDGVELAGGVPTTIIETATRNLGLRFRYKDSINNVYESVQIEIPIQDLRINRKQKVELPINLKWIHEQINPLEEGVTCDS